MNPETVFGKLGKWANKPIKNLPRDLLPIATAYIPRWDELTPKERTDRAIEVDRQRGLKSKLRYDRAVRAQRAARDPVQERIDWYDDTLDASHWAALGDISPIDAAMLLCCHNPNESSFDAFSSDETGSTSYETPVNSGMVVTAYAPKHLRMLARRLVDIDKADHKPRTLRDWHQEARSRDLAYHSWIDGYVDATAQSATPAPVETVGPACHNPAPLPLTTLDIAHCFDGLHWSESQWKTNLAKRTKNPGWLGADSIAIPGAQGGNETRWYPVRLGAALAAKQGIPPRSIRARFQAKPQLTDWKDARGDYEAQYLATE